MNGGATFEERIGEVLPDLYDGARLLTEDSARAADLLVSVSIESARRYGRFERPPDFRRWILTRLVRRCMDDVEAETKRTSPADGVSAEEGAVPALPGEGALESLVARLSALDRSAPERLAKILQSSLEELPLERRAAVWLVDRMRFDYADAARALGVSPTELRSLLFRARRELQLLLGLTLGISVSGPGDARKEAGEA